MELFVFIIVTTFILVKIVKFFQKRMAHSSPQSDIDYDCFEKITITMKDSPKARLLKKIVKNGSITALSDTEDKNGYIYVSDPGGDRVVGFVLSGNDVLEQVFNVKKYPDGKFRVTDGKIVDEYNIKDFKYEKTRKICAYLDRRKYEEYCLKNVTIRIT